MSINKVIQAGVKNGGKQFTEAAQNRYRSVVFRVIRIALVLYIGLITPSS